MNPLFQKNTAQICTEDLKKTAARLPEPLQQFFICKLLK
jgi:hypothetical protein